MTKKTEPQSNCSSSAPETSGPSAEIPPPSADQSAIDLVRSGPAPERGDQRQRGREGHPGGEPAEEAGEEEDRRSRARSAASSEAGIASAVPSQQHLLAAVAVAERAEVEDRGGEPERVADGDQVEAGLAGVEGLADVRQGDVGDREVEVGDRGDGDQRRQHELRLRR